MRGEDNRVQVQRKAGTEEHDESGGAEGSVGKRESVLDIRSSTSSVSMTCISCTEISPLPSEGEGGSGGQWMWEGVGAWEWVRGSG